MATGAQLRKFALALPETEEKSHFEHPDFRVKNKIFATLWPGEKQAVVKVGREEMEQLSAAAPDTFVGLKGFERGGWMRIELGNIEVAELKRLLRQSWSMVAPKKLVAAQNETKKKKSK